MKRFLLVLLVLVLIVIGAAIALPFFIPASSLRGPIEQQVENATGRELSLGGDLSLRLLPSLQFAASDVTFGNRPGGEAAHMASMKEMRVGLALFPLMSGRVEIAEFVLIEPVINLEVARDGTPNWEFEGTGAPEQTQQQTPAPEQEAVPADGQPLAELVLGDVRLVDGLVSYVNRQSGESYRVEDIDLTLALPSLDGPFDIDGGLTYEGARQSLTAKLAAPRRFFAGETSEVSIDVRSSLASLSFEGSAAAVEGGALPLAGTGRADLDIPSLRDLARWLGQPLEGDPGTFGRLALDGDVATTADEITFNDARVGFDETNGTGNLTISLAGSRPRVTGTLAVDRLDVTPYAGGGTSGGGGGGGGGSGGSSGWSTEPMDLSALKAVDADLAFTADQIRFNDIKLDRSNLTLNLVNGLLEANLRELALYGGGGMADLVVDARRRTPTIRQSINFDAVDLLPLLTDAIDLTWLEGIGNIEMTMNTTGLSQRDLIAALNGEGRLLFNDGAIRGINLAALVRNVGSAVTSLSLDPASQKTDFAELSGTFSIRNGRLTNDDLALLNPLLRILGEGEVNLVEQTLRYRLVPEAVASLEGQGGQRDLTGASVPILISGSFNDLRVGPDIADIGRRLLGTGILGSERDGTTAEGAEGEPQEEEDVGRQLLRGLLGIEEREAQEPAEGDAPADGAAPPAATEEPEPAPANPLEQLFGR